jgi:hypothetical protein
MQNMNGFLSALSRAGASFAGSPSVTPTSPPKAPMPMPFSESVDLGFMPDPGNDPRCARRRLKRAREWEKAALVTGVAVGVTVVVFALVVKAAKRKSGD